LDECSRLWIQTRYQLQNNHRPYSLPSLGFPY